MASDNLRYRALGTNQIRFVSFRPIAAEAEFDAPIASPSNSTHLDCYLYRGPRDMQDLVALSYVWGPKEDVDQVRIHGHEIAIQANLKAAMTAISKQRPTVLLWIDALCINQMDDVEKSIQVGRMKDVYRNAKQVIAWLGPADDSSDELMMKMTKAGSILRSPFEEGIPATVPAAWATWSFLERCGYMMGEEANQIDWKSGTWAHFFVNFRVNDEPDADLSTSALDAFFKRPFWRRAWIIQEFSLAGDLHLQCGENSVSIEDFLEVYDHLNLLHVAALRIPGLTDFQKAAVSNFFGTLVAQASVMLKIRGRYRRGQEMKIEDLLIEAFAKNTIEETHEATDARDRIFGLLGLASSCSIQPDYATSCADVYTRFAEQMLIGGNTNILQYTTFPKKLPDLPSWVPDWSSTTRRMLRKVDLQGLRALEEIPTDKASYLNFTNASRWLSNSLTYMVNKIAQNLQYDAESSPPQSVSPLDFTNGSCGIRQLHISGSVLGRIERTFPQDDLVKQKGQEIVLFKTFGRFTRVLEESCLYGCSQCNETQHYPTKELIAKVICANHASANGTYTPFTSSEYRTYYDYCTEDPPDLKSEMCQPAGSYALSVFHTVKGRRPFVTSNGWLGIAALHIEPGDLVCSLENCKSPYILRKKDNGCYNFLGECFVGANDEEAQARQLENLATLSFCIE